jgi:hypothetical protein
MENTTLTPKASKTTTKSSTSSTRSTTTTTTTSSQAVLDDASKSTGNASLAKANVTQVAKARILSMPGKPFEYTNPCQHDPDLCRKQPSGNSSYVCVKSFITQDYTLCLPAQAIDCKNANPCINDGICVEDVDPASGESEMSSWRCICGRDFTGRLCETEICSLVFKLLENHTMCVPDSKHFYRGEINSSSIDLIVDFHNAIRRQVAPIATNMQKVNPTQASMHKFSDFTQSLF